MTTELVQLAKREFPWRPLSEKLIVGKDILELLSSSMYVDPLSIYREYVQNSADAIEDARVQGLLQSVGRIDVDIDAVARTVTITDNGAGIRYEEFVERLTAFGASTKRGRGMRGFRGVGRLAGIGYCQELVFRSRAEGDPRASELRWDCRKLKELLRSADPSLDLSAAVAQVVSVRQTTARTLPHRFFAVELRGIVRHRNDQLLSPVAVAEYLSQVAPVPLHPEFPFRDIVLSHLQDKVRLGEVHIFINGNSEPLSRPHAAGIQLRGGITDRYTEVQLLTLPAHDGDTAALGWVAHHGYAGALPAGSPARGLRVRSGNIQIGGDRLFEEIFPEPRFNSWAVGEVHVIDDRIIPNGRRDHFEQNVHFHNLVTHLAPAAREIAKRCRTSSVHRKWIRDFELREQGMRDRLGILKQGAIGRTERQRLAEGIRESLVALDRITKREALPVEVAYDLRRRLARLHRDSARLLESAAAPNALAELQASKRRIYQHVLGLIYECSTSQVTAKLLVDKILARIS
jgi:Histidine kinase-, DNA gyrase B-, and HSP90-like ATPase